MNAFRPLASALFALTPLCLLPAAFAQTTTTVSPGMTRQATRTAQLGQDIFSRNFNPALGFVFDALADYLDADEEDGFDLSLRALEFTGAASIDPSAWAYAVIVYEDDEVAAEEAAINYIGFDSNLSLRAGRFFVDFGKLMQTHEHDLRTLERPLPLRTYLGSELGGNGVQLDNWFAAGEATAVRYSLGVFASLLGEAEEEGDPVVAAFNDERKDVDELSLTARLTAFTDVGSNSQVQIGASARVIPEFTFEFEPSGAIQDGLGNTVFGVDATYGWTDDTATKRWTLGGEALLFTGDIGAILDDSGTPGDLTDDTFTELDEDAFGWFAFADYAWDNFNSVGVQYASVELPEDELPRSNEVEAYYTRFISDFHRFRVGVVHADADESPDSTRAYIQYTAFIGPHSHGVNW